MSEPARESALGRRRHYFVERSLQAAFVVEVWTYLAAYTVLLLLSLLAPVLLAWWNDAGVADVRMRAASQFLFLDGWVLPASLAVFAALGAVAVVRSNRFAGPVHRLKAVTQQVGQGDFSVRVRLRERDFLKDLADLYNDMLQGLGGRIGTTRELAKKAQGDLEALRADLRTKGLSPDEIAGRLAEIESRQAQAVQALDRFSL